MADWSTLHIGSKSAYKFTATCSIRSSALAEWLFRSLLISEPEKYWLLPDILSASELFPFDLEAHNVLPHRSMHLAVERDSNGAEIVGMRAP